MNEIELKQFERWAKPNYDLYTIDGIYEDSDTHHAWMGWQAATTPNKDSREIDGLREFSYELFESLKGVIFDRDCYGLDEDVMERAYKAVTKAEQVFAAQKIGQDIIERAKQFNTTCQAKMEAAGIKPKE